MKFLGFQTVRPDFKVGSGKTNWHLRDRHGRAWIAYPVQTCDNRLVFPDGLDEVRGSTVQARWLGHLQKDCQNRLWLITPLKPAPPRRETSLVLAPSPVQGQINPVKVSAQSRFIPPADDCRQAPTFSTSKPADVPATKPRLAGTEESPPKSLPEETFIIRPGFWHAIFQEHRDQEGPSDKEQQTPRYQPRRELRLANRSERKAGGLGVHRLSPKLWRVSRRHLVLFGASVLSLSSGVTWFLMYI